MTSKKKVVAAAKTLFKESLTEDKVDEKKIRKILDRIGQQKNPQAAKILKVYKRLVERALSWEEILVEAGEPVAKDVEKTLLLATGARKAKFKVDPKIVLGAKITHGDWIYDATLEAKLKQLTALD